jgi:hypothetical protein
VHSRILRSSFAALAVPQSLSLPRSSLAALHARPRPLSPRAAGRRRSLAAASPLGMLAPDAFADSPAAPSAARARAARSRATAKRSMGRVLKVIFKLVIY